MVGVLLKFPIFFNFTLAFFDDFGCYVTNRLMVVPLQYGMNLGCSFVQGGNNPGCDVWLSDLY